MGIKKACSSFLMALTMFLFVTGLGQAAHLNVITSSPSWYYGQRGAGVLEEVSEGEPFQETTFGHLTPDYEPSPPLMVQGYGSNEIQGSWTNTFVFHGFSIGYGNSGNNNEMSMTSSSTSNNQNHVEIRQDAWAEGNVYAGEESSVTHVQITDNNWGSYGAYADSTVIQAMQIEADDGESIGDSVTVTVSTTYWWRPYLELNEQIGMIEGIISGPAGTSGFTVYRKDSNGNILETYAYEPVTLDDTSPYSPSLGYALWDLTIDAAVGDIIEVDSAIFSKIYLDAYNEESNGINWEGDASLSVLTSVDVASSPVPLPAAAWLLGSGLLGLVAMRRSWKV